ncbi:MAG: hypothetical protein IT204_25050 [Fimbriimonadaceae bacterium]|nr:hypothetical protein [Fimbriimonadaceae bacterium]
MTDETAARLAGLRVDLLDEYADGRRQRLYARLQGVVRGILEHWIAECDEPQQVAAWLLLHAALVHAARRVDVNEPLIAELTRLLRPTGPLAEYVDPDVTRAYVQTSSYRSHAWLPAPLAQTDSGRLSALVTAVSDHLGGLPPQFWDAVVLSSCRPARATRGGLCLVVPPLDERSGSAVSGLLRPLPRRVEPELLAATPAGATVVDAAAERLWFDEALAAVVAAAPARVALWLDPALDRRPAVALVASLRQLLPALRLSAVVPAAEVALADYVGFDAVVLGPPFNLGVPADQPLIAPGEVGRYPDVGAWPLACYRREPSDADLWLPVAGRDGEALAADLAATLQRFPVARVRLAAGLSHRQAAALALALPRPVQRHWSLELHSPALPGDPVALHAAGLRQVCLRVGPGAVPLAALEPCAAALQQLGLELLVEAESPADPAELLAALAAAGPAAVSFCGPQRDAAQRRWEAARR